MLLGQIMKCKYKYHESQEIQDCTNEDPKSLSVWGPSLSLFESVSLTM